MDAEELRRRAARLHVKAGRSWLFPRRAQRLSIRAWNYAQAARLAERTQEVKAAPAAPMRPSVRDERREYALMMATVAPSQSEQERQARIAAYDARFGGA